MTWSYAAFGLTFTANHPIPGLTPQDRPAEADISIQLNADRPHGLFDRDHIEPWYVSDARERDAPALRVWRAGHRPSFRLMYADGTEFLVDAPRGEIRATWSPPSTLADTATYLLGPVLAFLLRLRGVACLHASAVAIGDRAVAFAGPAEAGKSTLAAAFAQMGIPVLADDVVALTSRDGAPYVQPAYPQLRLWPDAAAALWGSADRLPRLTPTWDKRALDLMQGGYRFQEDPLPLAAVYWLQPRSASHEDVRIEEVKGRLALQTLIANSYSSYLLDSAARAHEFRLLGDVAARVPVRRVVPQAHSRHLTRLCACIVEDAEALGV